MANGSILSKRTGKQLRDLNINIASLSRLGDPSKIGRDQFGRPNVGSGVETIVGQNIEREFSKHGKRLGEKRSQFRETQGLFTTGLNLSRLRALSSIRG